MKGIVSILSAVALFLSMINSCSDMEQMRTETGKLPQKSPVVTTSEKKADKFAVNKIKKSKKSKVENKKNTMKADKKKIIDIYKRLQQAMIDKDTDTLREMIGADTIVRHITGRTQTMDEWLLDIENEEMKYYSIELKDTKVVINGDKASLTCSNVIDTRIYRARGVWTLPGGAEFEKKDGEWVMVHPENN